MDRFELFMAFFFVMAGVALVLLAISLLSITIHIVSK